MPRGMGPTQQRFDPEDLTSSQVQLGLVVQHQLAFVYRSRQLVGQAHTVGAVDVPAVDGKAGAALFGAIHGYIGVPHQLIGVSGITCHRHAHAGPDTSFDRVEGEGLLQAVDDPLGDLDDVVGVTAQKKDHELIATESNNDVRGAQAGPESGTDLSQNVIAGGMAERVVDLLEMVEIDEKEGDIAVLGVELSALTEYVIEQARQIAPVVEPGQLVGDGVAVTLLAQGLQGPSRQHEPDAHDDEGGARKRQRCPAHRTLGGDEDDPECARGSESG